MKRFPLLLFILLPILACKPFEIVDRLPITEFVDELHADQFESGPWHACFMYRDKTFCWGEGFFGMLGNLSDNDQAGKAALLNPPAHIQKLALGAFHTCAVTTDGVYCWGRNAEGQIGVAGPKEVWSPTRISGLSNAISLAAGWYHNCAVVREPKPSVQCWGDNSSGQLTNRRGIANSLTPLEIPLGIAPTDRVQISAGAEHTCVLLTSGVYCWGGNRHGQVKGVISESESPQLVKNLPSNIQRISAGAYHTCAVTDREVRCWGEGASAQPFSLPAPITSLAAGVSHTCAVAGGEAYCWGDNQVGQVAPGQPRTILGPTHVKIPLVKLEEVHVGANYSCGWGGGHYYCWGNSSNGSLKVPVW